MKEFDFSYCRTADELKTEIQESINYLQGHLNKLEEFDDSNDGEDMGAFVRRVKQSRDLEFFPTGLSWLDCELYGAGLAEGSFINIAGGSFAGKTTFVLELLRSMARGYKVCFFSYEMYEKILIRKFEYAPYDVLKNIYIYQKGESIDKITSRIAKKSKDGYKIFAIDSRMKIRVSDPKLSEYEKNNEISRKLSELTRKLGVIIILINQISEADLKAGRNSLKGSGDQVYDSDMIIYLKATTNDRKEVIRRELEIAKDRIGERMVSGIIVPNFFNKKAHGADDVVEFSEEIA